MGTLKALGRVGQNVWKSSKVAVVQPFSIVGSPAKLTTTPALGLRSHLSPASSPVCKQQVCCFTTKKEIEENLKEFKEGKFDKIPDPGQLPHFKKELPPEDSKKDVPAMGTYTLPHPIWSKEHVNKVEITHKPPEGKVEKLAYASVQLLRSGFDFVSGYKRGVRTENKWLNRVIFLETVAGVPGMVAAMARHMRSLRLLQRDYGWIHTLLEEAENERMHLMVALQLKEPSLLFRTAIVGAQGVFVTMFSLAYVLSPRFCHRFVGYLEEEAVKTYTSCVEDIDSGCLTHWQTQPAPEVAVRYWKLGENATLRDMILAIRADEAHHRTVNHTLASMKKDEFNPYKPGQ